MRRLISPRRLLLNYFSTLSVLVAGWYICFYVSDFHQGILKAFAHLWFLDVFRINIPVYRLFVALLILYAVVLLPYYASAPFITSKTWIALRGLYLGIPRLWHAPRCTRLKRKPARKPVLSTSTRQASLALLLKFFFAPLMINWCLGHIGDMLDHIEWVKQDVRQGMGGRWLFDHALFMALFQIILFVDTLLFTLGYIIEMPRLKNRIVSVDASLLGWVVCLACYPPFNQVTGYYLPWQSTDFPHFANDALHLLVNIGILVLMGIYSWSSVALGWKASNLTNRGIVSHGPYAWVRHPAYVAKNTAWWLGALPGFYMAWQVDTGSLLKAIACTAGWSVIYAARALTEERHLLRANNGYQQYMQRVRWRFIPGVL